MPALLQAGAGPPGCRQAHYVPAAYWQAVRQQWQQQSHISGSAFDLHMAKLFCRGCILWQCFQLDLSVKSWQALTIDCSFKLVPCFAYQLCNVAARVGSLHATTVSSLQHAFCRRGVRSASVGAVYSMSDLEACHHSLRGICQILQRCDCPRGRLRGTRQDPHDHLTPSEVGCSCADLHELSPRGSLRLSLLRQMTRVETRWLLKSPKLPAGHTS